MTAPPILGRVVATERKPNTPHEFHFWTALDAPVGIGTIVRVESERPVGGVLPVVYGVVTEGFGYTDLQTPLHDVLGADGVPGRSAIAPTERTEIRLYTAAVLRHVPEEPLQPVPMGTVHLATEADVQAALRMESYLQPGASRGIPIGLYRAGGTQAAVHLDADFLLGPEAAHLSISGVSGLATKTSAVEWLLGSIFAHFPAEKGGVAAVCFNVKGPDLCFLDQPASALSDDERTMYETMGVPAAPFTNVRYFAPWTAKGFQLATLRSNDALQDNVQPLTWGLRETLQYAEVLLNKDDVDAKADALIDFIKERVLDQVFTDPLFEAGIEVRSFADLERWFSTLLRGMEGKNADVWRTHHVATIRKVRNRLSNISTRCRGLVTDDGSVSDLPFGEFEDRAVYVVDVANLEEDAQDLVFARVVSQLREHLEKRQLGVSQVVVFVDELNKYAPADGPDTYVRKMLLDIAERGRYLGLVLFGAQQFRSQVHRRVVGNSGTAVFGRMDPDELATPGYQTLAPAIKGRLATLEKGQLMVRHPHFGQPIFVRFPRPAVLTGREGVERFPPAEDLPLDAAVTKALRRLDPAITLSWVQDCIALAGDSEDEILRARNRTLQTRPDDVKAFFKAQLRKRVAAAPAARRGPAPLRPPPPDDDPYGG
ncbi:MAG: ATP-binding protein [Gemmatimonadaceae bacterium]|nr:ATP-binding protein [Gemmatimonadaceae bacterium]MCW5825949.1 ATP-binding protein [Gemmatimonadaceae bacterium]